MVKSLVTELAELLGRSEIPPVEGRRFCRVGCRVRAQGGTHIWATKPIHPNEGRLQIISFGGWACEQQLIN